ncbi:MAG: MoaD/ThiS family protein [Sulfuritalea sp.]|nr:MoaD/ThiS family protein [Sulfuritalea sp.]
MRITFKLFATLQDYLPPEAKKTNALSLEIDSKTTVADLVKRFSLPEKLVHLVLIDGNFVPPAERSDRTLQEGETLAIWPPVAGG